MLHFIYMQEIFKKYFFVVLLIVSLTFGVLLFWPFLTLLILSIIFAVVFSPIHEFFLRKVKKRGIASFLTVAVFLLVLCVPLFFGGMIIFNQAQNIYAGIQDGDYFNSLIQTLNNFIERFIPGANIDLKGSLIEGFSRFTTGLGNILTATAQTVFSFILFVLSMYYFLKDGAHWRNVIQESIPLAKESSEKIVDQFKRSFNGIIKGYLFVGLIQGLLTAIGLWIFGVPNALLWGCLAAIASVVPTVGPAIVPVPAILFLFATGQMGAAIGFSLWSILVVGGVDNVINPYFVGRSVNIHPLTALFSILGGIILMGPVGIVIGPLIIGFIHTLIGLTKTELTL